MWPKTNTKKSSCIFSVTNTQHWLLPFSLFTSFSLFVSFFFLFAAFSPWWSFQVEIFFENHVTCHVTTPNNPSSTHTTPQTRTYTQTMSARKNLVHDEDVPHLVVEHMSSSLLSRMLQTLSHTNSVNHNIDKGVIWTPKLHRFFPADTRTRIKTFLVAAYASRKKQHNNNNNNNDAYNDKENYLALLPVEILYVIAQHIASGILFLRWPEGTHKHTHPYITHTRTRNYQ